MNLALLLNLLAAHALCDFPLQGDFLARTKDQTKWPWPLFAWPLFWHALIHGAAVAAVTHHIEFGLFELVLHAAIDYAKSAGRFTFSEDQALHALWKVAYWGLLTFGG